MKPKDPVSKENAVGPVYKIKCEEFEATYVVKQRSLKSRFNRHGRRSSTTSKVAKHIHLEQPEHSVELENNEILTTESRRFERGDPGEGGHIYKCPEAKPQQIRWKVQFASSMGQHHEGESEGR